ncbi:MAG: lipopolysaccharide assembly protein LapA domain-containing protein [Aquisalimonadaceae bacterium]
MRRIIGFIVVLLVVLFGLSFSLLNADTVAVDYYFGELNLPLSLLLVFSLIIGALAGVLACLAMVMTRTREMRRLRRRLTDTEKELNELRRLPLKDKL